MAVSVPAGRRDLLGRRPLNLCACTVSALSMSPRPSTLTGGGPAHRPRSRSSSGVTTVARLEPLGELVEVHHGVLDAERVVEPALGHAPVQRHLAALEPALELEARARLRALVAAPGRLAVARPLAAADALAAASRPWAASGGSMQIDSDP
jgi:hypothetical protein